MNKGGINIWAVLVAAVGYWLMGAAWFTILRDPWLASVGKTMEQLQGAVNAGVAYSIALVSNLIIAYVLGWVVVRTGEQTAVRGITVGALLWVGLVGTTIDLPYGGGVRVRLFKD